MSYLHTTPKERENLTPEETWILKNLCAVLENKIPLNVISKNPVSYPERLNPAQLAAYLGVSKKTVYARAARRAKNPWPFPVRRVGRLLSFVRSEVDAALRKEVV